MPTPGKKRIRRSPEDARAHVIQCAEKILIDGGPLAIQMRSVAREAGITDAGIAYHFTNREGLLTALMDHGSSKVRLAIDRIVEAWLAGGTDISGLISELGQMYGSGYAKLALQVQGSGWQETGEPLLRPVVEALWASNQNPSTTKEDIQICLASLHLWLALDPLFGGEFRKSVGLHPKSHRDRQAQWWIEQIKTLLVKPENG
ncbi:MAG: TetR/AcrR family transcriptional regulator [Sneathiella sp.]